MVSNPLRPTHISFLIVFFPFSQKLEVYRGSARLNISFVDKNVEFSRANMSNMSKSWQETCQELGSQLA